MKPSPFLKAIRPVTLAAFAGVFLAGCDFSTAPKPPDASMDQEVERRVAQLRLEDRLAELELQLRDQELDLEQKEQLLADQRLLIEEISAASAAAPTPEPTPASGTAAPAPAAQPAPAPAHDYSTFYQELSPHGTWFETPQYGYIWQPRASYRSAGWQPYTRGYWAHTNLGWTWVSEEPFGWAVYHYGRWVNLSGSGWCWVPGYEWAPAWVSWRYSDSYIGWAPLPPRARFSGNHIGINVDLWFDIGPGHYAFVSSRHFGARNLYRHVLPERERVTIINNTVNVTNITRNNLTIINQGPDYDRVQSFSSEPIRTGRLERENRRPSGDRLSEWQDDTLRIASPVIPETRERTRRTAPERAQRIAATERRTGWEAVADTRERAEIRNRMARQATASPVRERETEGQETGMQTQTRETTAVQPDPRERQARTERAERERNAQRQSARETDRTRQQQTAETERRTPESATAQQREAQARATRERAEKERNTQRQSTQQPNRARQQQATQNEQRARESAAAQQREAQARATRERAERERNTQRQSTQQPNRARQQQAAQNEQRARESAASQQRNQQSKAQQARPAQSTPQQNRTGNRNRGQSAAETEEENSGNQRGRHRRY